MLFTIACKYYLKAQRRPAAKCIYQKPLYPIDQEIGEKYTADLKKYRPAAIVVEDKTVFEHAEDKTAQKVKAFLEENYDCDYNGGAVQLYFLKKEAARL